MNAPAATMPDSRKATRFRVILIKPSHYDDDGYVIQWAKSWIPSNSLACLYALAQDIAARLRSVELTSAALGLTPQDVTV